jgi:phospholipid/cholesterol/gamma-HCH transport system substrate-binding protein
METQARYIVVGLCAAIAAAAAFFFVYWLHSTGGVGKQALYRVQFDEPVIGLRPGVAVLFNGLRVGEVRSVQLDPSNPKLLLAVIAVDPAAPVRQDTHVGIDAQGLMGSTVVSLTGGSAPAVLNPGPGGEPPLLLGDPDSSESLGHAAKGTLKRIDAILDDNAAALRSGITNLNTFSDALARNSGPVDTILAGLEKTMGGGEPAAPLLSYDLSLPQFLSADRSLTTQIAVPEITPLIVFETQRAMASPKSAERQPLEPGQWSDSLPKLVQAKIEQSLESAGFSHVAKSTEGFTSDVQLLLDIRSFELRLLPEPSAQVEISAKLLGSNGKIMGSQSFQASAPAAGADAPAAFAALNQAFGKVAYDLVLWVEATI